jgi:hypothetical protein
MPTAKLKQEVKLCKKLGKDTNKLREIFWPP